MVSKTVYLRSGKWRCYGTPDVDDLELVDPARPTNKMRVPLPPGTAGLPERILEEIVRRPEVRLWTDEHGIPWRVSAVGPGTPYDFLLTRRHVLFDSEQAWAGIVEFPEGLELGDLTEQELRRMRDQVADVGGRRRGFRPPPRTTTPRQQGIRLE